MESYRYSFHFIRTNTGQFLSFFLSWRLQCIYIYPRVTTGVRHYKDWKLYDNNPVKILKTFGVTVNEKMKKSILGQESAMWSEQVIVY